MIRVLATSFCQSIWFIVILVVYQQARAQTPTASQVVNNPELVHARLRVVNPGYRDQAQFELDPDLGLVGDFSGGGVVDLAPLKGIPFGALDLKGLQVSDLTPLQGMPLRILGVEETGVSDLRPLAGMRLEKLYLNATIVSDLRPLSRMPLTELMLVETQVKDLRPLHGMPLQQLWLNNAPVADISPLGECPLISLTLEGTKVVDLRPLASMSSMKRLHIGDTPVTDLSPLKNLKLTRLIFSPGIIKQGLDSIRKMKSLTELGTTLDNKMAPKQFWQLYDQGKLR